MWKHAFNSFNDAQWRLRNSFHTDLLILITSVYFVGALEFCKQVTSCICKRILNKFSLAKMSCSKLSSKTNTPYKVTRSSICTNTAQEQSAHPSSPSRIIFSSYQCLLGKAGIKFNQRSMAARGRALNCCWWSHLSTQCAALQAINTHTERTHERSVQDHRGGWQTGTEDEMQCNVRRKSINIVELLVWVGGTLTGDIFILVRQSLSSSSAASRALLIHLLASTDWPLTVVDMMASESKNNKVKAITIYL